METVAGDEAGVHSQGHRAYPPWKYRTHRLPRGRPDSNPEPHDRGCEAAKMGESRRSVAALQVREAAHKRNVAVLGLREGSRRDPGLG